MNKEEQTIRSFDFGAKIKEKTNLLSIQEKQLSQQINAIAEPETIKIKATNFTNNITKILDKKDISYTSIKPSNNNIQTIITKDEEIKEVNPVSSSEKSEEDEYKGLKYSQIVELEAKKYENIYASDLAKFDISLIRQSLAKIIINPELKKLALPSQSLVKTFIDNISAITYHVSQFLKDDQKKLMHIFHEINMKDKENKLIPQKIKDINILFFKLLEVNYFLRFKE